MKKTLRILSLVLNNFEKAILCCTFSIMAVLCFTQVVCRYLLSISLPWAEELLRAMFVWSSCLGTSLAFLTKSHLGVDAITSKFPKQTQKYLQMFVYFICIICFAILIFYSIKITGNHFVTMQRTPAMLIPVAYISIALPIGFGLSILRICQVVYKDYIKKQPSDSGEDFHISEGLL